MKKPFHITICFENSAFNFSSSSGGSSQKEIKEDLIGKLFHFDFKNEGSATCIDVVFPEKLG